jgi:hypothetical protein
MVYKWEVNSSPRVKCRSEKGGGGGVAAKGM